MRKRIKYITAWLLILALGAGLCRTTAWAAYDVGGDERNVRTQANEMTMEGTDSVGTMLAAAFADELNKETKANSQENYITELEINGTTAQVAYQTARNAQIVVAVYDEDSGKMLGSGTTDIDGTVSEASIALTVEGGSMPQYFVAIAYMLDTESHEPMCEKFVTQAYTKTMQDFLNTTVDDYDEDLVLNLDDNRNTNFGVYNDKTIQAETTPGKNLLTDNGDGTYTIRNADQTFTGLKKGDTFSYDQGDGNVLLVKAAAVTVKGTTVTVTEEKEVDLSDFFDYMKIEADTTDSACPMTVDNSNLEEGVTYQEPEAGVRRMAWEGEGSLGHSVSYTFDKKTFKGSFTYGFTASLKYYLFFDYQYVSVKIEYSEALKVEISAEFKKEFSLARIEMAIVPGVNLGFDLSLVVEASATISWTGEIKGTIGFAYDSDSGPQNLCRQPSTSSKIEISGTLFVGVRPKLYVTIIHEKLFEASLETTPGLEISAKKMLIGDSESSRHECAMCFEGEIHGKVTAKAKIKILDGKYENEIIFIEIKGKISDFYWSVDRGEFGFKTCPYISYCIKVTVKDENKNPVAGAKIQGTKLAQAPVTDEKGEVSFYLKNGRYNLTAESGDKIDGKGITVMDGGKDISMNLKKKTVNNDTATSGTCGNNLKWAIDKEYRLTISSNSEGSVTPGDMDSYAYNAKYPWEAYRKDIRSVVLADGVVSIGKGAFRECTKLNEISIPNSVQRIGGMAFSGCTGLKNVNLPANVRDIGVGAFSGCENLDSIVIPEGVESVTAMTFMGCMRLKNVVLPPSVKHIAGLAFGSCRSLTSITIPGGGTMEDEAFSFCDGLKTVYFTGDAPQVTPGESVVFDHMVTAYYPLGNTTWTEDVKAKYGENLDWVAKEYSLAAMEEIIPLKAFIGSTVENGDARKASFTGLVPGEDYVFMAVKKSDAENLSAADNLLYIMQDSADKDGKLTFTYVPRTKEPSEIRVYGMSDQNLADAQITVDKLVYNGKTQAPKVTVIYKGKTLEEDRDYILSGNLTVTEAGTYSVTVTGKNDYAGSVEKSYQVEGSKTVVKGDVNGDKAVNLLDLMLCLNHVSKKNLLTGDAFAAADVDGNNVVNLLDLMRILNYVSKKTSAV